MLSLGCLLAVVGIISREAQKLIELVVAVLIFIKLIIWMFAEFYMIGNDIIPHCSGGIVAYGYVMTILLSITALVICCLFAAMH